MFERKDKDLPQSLPPGARYSMLQVGKENSNGLPPIYLDGNILLKTLIHSRSSLDQPVNGVFLGELLFWNKTPYLEIGGTIENQLNQGLPFSEDAWVYWQGQREAKGEVLGWYCSQPGAGITLGSEIMANQRHFFSQSHNFLLLIEPILRRYGLFQWKESELRLIPGFKVTSLPEKKEQLRQLLHQSGFLYAEEVQSQPAEVNIYPAKLIRAYQPRKLEEIEEELAQEQEEISFLLTRKEYREVFLSKDILVNKEIRTREGIQKIIDSILEELVEIPSKALIRLYWEVKAGDDQYYTDHWICEIRWLGKSARHSVIWNTELT